MSTIKEKQLYGVILDKCNKKFSERAYINLSQFDFVFPVESTV